MLPSRRSFDMDLALPWLDELSQVLEELDTKRATGTVDRERRSLQSFVGVLSARLAHRHCEIPDMVVREAYQLLLLLLGRPRRETSVAKISLAS